MGRVFLIELNCDNIYACDKCGCHLSSMRDLVSKAFSGRSGTAFLFGKVVNVTYGNVENKQLRTGMHATAPAFCKGCDKEVGWYYEHAYEENEKYKTKKTILEKKFIKKLYWN